MERLALILLDGVVYLLLFGMRVFVRVSDKIIQLFFCRHQYDKYDTNTCMRCGKEG